MAKRRNRKPAANDVYDKMLSKSAERDTLAARVETMREDLQQAEAQLAVLDGEAKALAPQVLGKAQGRQEPVNLLAVADGLGRGLSIEQIEVAEPDVTDAVLQRHLKKFDKAVEAEAARKRKAVAKALQVLAGAVSAGTML